VYGIVDPVKRRCDAVRWRYTRPTVPGSFIIWQRPKHQTIDHREHRGVGPDAQSEGHDGRDGERGRADQAADGVAQILNDGVERREAPGVTARFALKAGMAELLAGRGERGGARQSFVLEVARQQLDVRAHFIIELRREMVAAHPCDESAEHLSGHHGSALRSTRLIAATDRLNADVSSPS
jgi:hypothetical protein